MKLRSKQKGVAIVEFALVVPLLFVLMFIVTEFGRALMQYNTIVKSARDAARYLSIQLPGTKIAEAKNLVVYGNPAGSGPALVPGLTLAQVADPVWEPAGTDPVITVVRVEITGFTFQPMMDQVITQTIGPLTLSPIRATMRSHL